MKTMPQKVVIDTDFGTDVDDAIAVALAMASDEIEVQAFTVVGRQSIYRKQMLENVLSFLGDDCAAPPVYAGWDAPTPVPYGFSLTAAPSPTTSGGSFPGTGFGDYLKRLGAAYQFNWFGDEGTLDPASPTQAPPQPPARPFPPPPPPPSPPPATPAGYATFEAGQQLVNLLSNGDVDFIGLGPLTNLYQTLTSPSLAPHGDILIPRMTVMGVHLQPTLYPDNQNTKFVSAGVDYNLASDLVSALYVLNETAGGTSGPIGAAKWVTADVTLRTWLKTAHLKSLEASKHPFLQQLVKMIHAWTPIQTNLFEAKIDNKIDNKAFLHDPLTLACSFSDGWCDFEKLYLELDLTNTLGLRWIEREQGMPNTIELNCAVIPPTGDSFQEWLVRRLLDRFS